MQTLYNQLVYFGFLQSIFLLLIYVFIPKKRKNINSYLLFLVATLAIGLLGRILHSSAIFGQNFKFFAMSEIAATLFGPTLFLFVKSSLNKHQTSKTDLINYVPSLGYSLCVLFYFVIPPMDTAIERTQTGETMRAIYLFHAAGMLINITYWILSGLELKTFKKRMSEELSYSIDTRFLKQLIIVMGVIFFVWMVFYLSSLFGNEMFERNARPFIWLSLAFTILFITYYGMISPKVFKVFPSEAMKKYAQSKLSITDLDNLKLQLDAIMVEKKPYLNNKLLKAELAELLGISNPELARLLNERIGMNFFEYVNYHRIHEFIALAKSEKAQQLTFFGLAQEAGFNSKATFYNAFKKIMGSSPSVYFNNLNS